MDNTQRVLAMIVVMVSISPFTILAVPRSSVNVTESACNRAPTPEEPLLLAELQTWHGSPSHSAAFDGGRAYDSRDPEVIADQIADAQARGIDGFVIDWYGPPESGLENEEDRAFMDLATSRLFEEAAEAQFCLAILYDEGTLRLAGLEPADYPAQAASDLDYADEHYLSAPAYLRIDGKPALFVFPYPDVDPHLDWSALKAVPTTEVVLIDQDPNPEDHDHDANFDGFFAWVQPDAGGWDPHGKEWGELYLRWFYGIMDSPFYADKVTVGGVWPGFDDSLAPWGLDRFMSRAGGNVYDATWDLAIEYEAEIVLIATWNDFEEGTDVEFGVRMQVDMESAKPEILMRSSPLEVVWNKVGDDVLQVYEAGELIYDEPHSPPVSLTLERGRAYELKVWTNATDPFAKLVKIRRRDPDPAVVFCDGFESGDLSRWPAWEPEAQ